MQRSVYGLQMMQSKQICRKVQSMPGCSRLRLCEMQLLLLQIDAEVARTAVEALEAEANKMASLQLGDAGC